MIVLWRDAKISPGLASPESGCPEVGSGTLRPEDGLLVPMPRYSGFPWLAVLASCAASQPSPSATPGLVVAPLSYAAHHASGPVTVDGRLTEPAWRDAAWTTDFVDIEGALRPRPRFRTRVKMLWDDQYWYVAAELTEPDLWATIRERDAVIFRDNDFEIFVDPSGTAHRYFEIEMNQLATVWDLFLPKPYSEGGHAVNEWNISGLKIAVALNGTINHPGDRDRGWTVELAIPWAAFADSGHNVVPPHTGSQWRLNFSRVEWDVDPTAGGYRKRNGPTGKPLPEHNWVWSPQGVIDMHVPQRWGFIHFDGSR
jgi:cellulose/xylan binding protein with CBM9 domain